MQHIDLHAIVHNARYIKSYAETQLCAVVKNNAYGHGLQKVASVLGDVADCFAVASVHEALQISSYVCKILILLPIFDGDLPTASKHKFVLTVDSFDTLLRYVSSGLPLVVHVKTNSGMSRLGFGTSQLAKVCKILNDNKQIVVDGIFSHMRSGEMQSCQAQYDVFVRQCELVQNLLGKRITKHIANTSAVFCDKKFALDMVRVGLGLYGYGAPNLLTAKTVTAKVVANRVVDKGDLVGYDGIFAPTKRTCLAVINKGYADGFARSMVGSIVKINNCPAQVVAVCMGMTICVTPQLEPTGSTAVLLGEGINPSNEQTIVYELLCYLR